MELAAKIKIPDIPIAGRWKLLVAKLKKRRRAFTEQKLASEAAALADSRRRKEEATAPRRVALTPTKITFKNGPGLKGNRGHPILAVL